MGYKVKLVFFNAKGLEQSNSRVYTREDATQDIVDWARNLPEVKKATAEGFVYASVPGWQFKNQFGFSFLLLPNNIIDVDLPPATGSIFRKFRDAMKLGGNIGKTKSEAFAEMDKILSEMFGEPIATNAAAVYAERNAALQNEVVACKRHIIALNREAEQLRKAVEVAQLSEPERMVKLQGDLNAARAQLEQLQIDCRNEIERHVDQKQEIVKHAKACESALSNEAKQKDALALKVKNAEKTLDANTATIQQLQTDLVNCREALRKEQTVAAGMRQELEQWKYKPIEGLEETQKQLAETLRALDATRAEYDAYRNGLDPVDCLFDPSRVYIADVDNRTIAKLLQPMVCNAGLKGSVDNGPEVAEIKIEYSQYQALQRFVRRTLETQHHWETSTECLQHEFDLMIGRLDYILSQMIASVTWSFPPRQADLNKQTLKHHVEDMQGEAKKILSLMGFVEGMTVAYPPNGPNTRQTIQATIDKPGQCNVLDDRQVKLINMALGCGDMQISATGRGELTLCYDEKLGQKECAQALLCALTTPIPVGHFYTEYALNELRLERANQLEKRSPEYDMERWNSGQLAWAASALIGYTKSTREFPTAWDAKYCQRLLDRPYFDRLRIAGALVVAEIERYKRGADTAAKVNKERNDKETNM